MVWCVLLIPPTPAVSDQFNIDDNPIGQGYVCDVQSVLVPAVRLEGHLFANDGSRRSLLSLHGIGMTFFWAIDAMETDTFSAVVAQDFPGVTVKHPGDSCARLSPYRSQRR